MPDAESPSDVVWAPLSGAESPSDVAWAPLSGAAAAWERVSPAQQVELWAQESPAQQVELWVPQLAPGAAHLRVYHQRLAWIPADAKAPELEAQVQAKPVAP